jgi:arylsulfatase A-like enzyme
MSTRRLLSAAALLLLSACDRGTPVETPLLDGRHEPDILLEAPSLELPPSQEGNRFVRGWFPWKRQGASGLAPVGRPAVIELVQLEARARELVVRFSAFEPEAQRTVAVRVGGRDLGPLALANPLRIPLPADLPSGRVAVELDFGDDPRVAVGGARVRPSRPNGEVRFEADKIVQEPWSAIDFARRLEGEASLLGRFRAPAGKGARYRLTVENEAGEARTLFEWPAGSEDSEGSESFEGDLGSAGELVRVRLIAEGSGPAGRWEDLRIRSLEPPAAEIRTPEAPQLVVVYVLDALRADALGHLGGRAEVTPVIDRLASEGVTLTNHFSVAPNTMPSTKALFTGRAFRTKGGWKLPPEGVTTLAELWQQAGYRTGAFSANAFVSYAFGLARGFETAPRGVSEVDKASGRVAIAERVHRYGMRWLEQLDPSDRVLLYLHTVHPHNPYDPPEPYRSRLTSGIDSDIDGSTQTLLDVQHRRRETTAADRERLEGLYLGGLAYNDAVLGELLETLTERYPPGEVLVVLTADHGEELFDHGGVLHGYTLYDEQLHIPMLFWWPGVLDPRRIDAATDELDLHATLRALVAPEGAELGEGRNLWGLLQGDDALPPDAVRFAAASSLKGGIFMARSSQTKLIWAPRTGSAWGQGQGLGRSHDPEYLFDLESDPAEMANRAGGPSLRAAWLRSRMRAWIEREKLLDMEGQSPDAIDEETRQRLRALGYVD